jgi:hypothetical protein
MAGSTIGSAPSGEKTTPDGTEKIPVSGSQFVQMLNFIGRKLRETGGTTLSMGAVADGEYLKRDGSNIIGATASASVKGRVEFLAATVPTTVGAPIGQISGGSSPVEGIPYFSFVDGTITYRDFYCRLIDYSGGGLTLNFEVLRTSATAALRYVFEAAVRRINTGTENITASHTYDYNAVTVTIPAGPPAAGIPMLGTITFTDGADMDSLANNEAFVLRIRRNATTANDDATDTARVLASITMRET